MVEEKKDENIKKEASAEDEARKKEFRKNLIIAIVLIVIVIGVALAVLIPMGAFIFGSAKPESPYDAINELVERTPELKESSYTEDYYNYIQEQDILHTKFDQDTIEEYEIGFIDVTELDDPVMVINGIYENEQSVTYLYKKNNGVAISTYAAPSEIKYLYDKSNNEYAYFVEQPLYNNTTRYVNVGEFAEGPSSNYSITIGDNEFREYFNNTGEEIDYTPLDKDVTSEELEDAILDASREHELRSNDSENDDASTDDEALTDGDIMLLKFVEE